MRFNTYVFADAGTINTNSEGNELTMSSLIADAGIGTTFSILRWGNLYGIKP